MGECFQTEEFFQYHLDNAENVSLDAFVVDIFPRVNMYFVISENVVHHFLVFV